MLWIGLLIGLLLGLGLGYWAFGRSMAKKVPALPSKELEPSLEEIGQLLQMEAGEREVRFRETYTALYEPVYELKLVDRETQKHLGGVALTGTAVMTLRDILNARKDWGEHSINKASTDRVSMNSTTASG